MVLRLLDRPFDVGNRFRRLIDQFFSLSNVQHRRDAAFLANPDDTERLLSRCQRSLCDIEFAVEFEQTEVTGCDVSDDSRHHRIAIFFGGAQVGARGFGLIAKASPDVQFEIEKVEQHAAEAAFLSALTGEGKLSVA